jgi:transposase
MILKKIKIMVKLRVMGRVLSKPERIQLLSRHKTERDKHVCDRIKAVLAYDEGYEPPDISKILLISVSSAYRYVNEYFAKKKLKPEHKGRESELDEEQSKELIKHLEENTYLYVKAICHYVKEKYEVEYSVSGMTKWLHRQGFNYKQPHAVPAKADKEQQAAFIKTYTELKASLGAQEPLYFVDSMHPAHQSDLAYGWIRKGQRKLIPTTARQPRMTITGAYQLAGQQFVYQESERVNSASMASFLYKLRGEHPEGQCIHLIWDNAGSHYGKEVKEAAKKLNIKLHYLPPYSPNLNPIERVWKIFRERVTYNKYYATAMEFREKVRDFFNNLSSLADILKNRITDNFQIIHSPLLSK